MTESNTMHQKRARVTVGQALRHTHRVNRLSGLWTAVSACKPKCVLLTRLMDRCASSLCVERPFLQYFVEESNESWIKCI